MGVSIQMLKNLASIPGVKATNWQGSFSTSLKRNKFRLSFYTFFAKRSKFYKNHYSFDSISNKFTKSGSFNLNLIHSNSITDSCLKLNKYGICCLEDVFNLDEYLKIKEFLSVLDNQSSKEDVRFGTVKCWNHAIELPDLIHSKLLNIVSRISNKVFLPLKRNRIKLNYQILQKEKNDLDHGDTNIISHSDRFIPTLKFFYYPYQCDKEGSPFSYVPFSHKITPDFLKAYIEYFEDLSSGVAPLFPCTIKNNLNIPSQRITLKGNTLICAFTNGLHNRTPFPDSELTKSKQRKTIQINIYNQQLKTSLFRFV